MNCSRNECGHKAKFKVSLYFHAIGGPENGEMTINLPLIVCDDHAYTDVEEFVPPESWELMKLGMALQGIVGIDDSSRKMEFTEISPEEMAQIDEKERLAVN